MTRLACGAALLGLTLSLAAGLPAHAEVRAKSFELEIFGGYYEPGADFVDGEVTYGGRLGYNFNRRWNLQGSIGYVQLDGEGSDPMSMTSGTFEVDLWNIDLALGYQFFVDSKVVPEVHGGIGGSFGNFSIDAVIPGFNIMVRNLSEDSFTANLGGSLKIYLGQTVYLRPAVTGRWFEVRDLATLDNLDWEASLALGFRFGGSPSPL